MGKPHRAKQPHKLAYYGNWLDSLTSKPRKMGIKLHHITAYNCRAKHICL